MNAEGLISFVKKHPVGVGCGVVALIMLVLTFTRGGSVETLETQLIELQDQSSRLKNNLRYSVELDEQLATVRQAIEGIEAKAITPGALATNLQFFYRLEQELGFTMIDLRQGVVLESKEPTEYLVVPYTVAVEGTYLQVLQFLQRLEQGGRIVQFETANISLSRGTPGQRNDPTDPRLVISLEIALLGRS